MSYYSNEITWNRNEIQNDQEFLEYLKLAQSIKRDVSTDNRSSVEYWIEYTDNSDEGGFSSYSRRKKIKISQDKFNESLTRLIEEKAIPLRTAVDLFNNMYVLRTKESPPQQSLSNLILLLENGPIQDASLEKLKEYSIFLKNIKELLLLGISEE